MHRGHQKSKLSLSLFRSSSLKSQASSLGEQETAHDHQQRRFSPHSSSPAASPLYAVSPSPSFPPTTTASTTASTTTSPVEQESDSRNLFQEYRPLPRELRVETATASAPRAEIVPRKLQRSQSHRSSPPANPTADPRRTLVGPKSANSARRPSSPVFDTDSIVSNVSAGSQQAPHQKKKRRFWSFGDSSTSKEKSPTSAKPLSSSVSTNLGQPASATSDSPLSQTSRRRWPTSSTLSSPVEVDESETSSLSKKIQNRHSVAFPTPTVPEELRSLSSSPGIDLLSTRRANSSEATATTTTASSHTLSPAQAGAQRAPARDRIGRSAPNHNRHASADHDSLLNQLASGQLLGHQSNRAGLHIPQSGYNPESRPESRQSIESPTPSQHSLAFHQKTPSAQSTPSIIEASMGSSSQQHSTGRALETTQSSSQSGSNREGQYGSTLSVNNQQGASGYRSTPQASPMVQQNSNSEQGRSTPPPSRSRDDLASLDVQQLISKHEELNDKYRKVKKYYFDKDAQVQQLQNTLAHQRLAQSRTSLDDNEYANRFSRLDGAINNLAFNIRKEWKAVPRWLAPYVNQDATTSVTKEMTAVGRACISRWIVDEIFDRYFHPALEPNLSSNLKIIERNLRRYAPPTQTEEERDALLAKISNWRLATLDGLQDMLNTQDAVEYRSSLTKILVEMLTADLMANLKEPGPVGLDAGVIGIIELAVGVAANLPLESRDVFIDYVMPGTPVNDQFMKVEGALPPLINPGDGPDADRASLGSVEDQEDDNGKDQGKKKGMFGSMLGGNGGGKKPVPSGGRSSESSDQTPKDTKVRFAAFMSVELKGKNMLIKAPVYV